MGKRFHGTFKKAYSPKLNKSPTKLDGTTGGTANKLQQRRGPEERERNGSEGERERWRQKAGGATACGGCNPR
ncbi:hypothetical protein Csa_009276 [Cucumis sativus]|uniref:Uncharacterized protein n=1 Tax=Cucumis sativus TaxID=3659 RepID=A0A0A0KSS6_CUCSA|nr:hypothetical protein Csa_009276 [Cucumis sativus]